jgi:hypothetical protein
VRRRAVIRHLNVNINRVAHSGPLGPLAQSCNAQESIQASNRFVTNEVAKDELLWCGSKQQRADTWAADLPDERWQRLSCGAGAKGPRRMIGR